MTQFLECSNKSNQKHETLNNKSNELFLSRSKLLNDVPTEIFKSNKIKRYK